MSSQPSQQNAPDCSLQARFDVGDYAGVALHGTPEDWRYYAALGLIGKTREAQEGLQQFEGDAVRFYEAVTCWIGGEDVEAMRLLTPLTLPHAQNLLALIRKPVLRVLTQWPANRLPPLDLLNGAQHDARFEVRNVSFHPDDIPNQPGADIQGWYDTRTPPDFYTCLMAEWHLLPPNLSLLPCPILAATADYDVHLQTVLPWLRVFDELIVSSQTEWGDVYPLTSAPVSSFPKLVGVSETLPALKGVERRSDVFFSGTVQHPYHPDKARLLQQVMEMSDLRIHIINGFVELEDYYALLGDTRVCYAYVRHPGAMATRGLEALSMGCAVAVQRECVLTLWAGENEGVLTYDLNAGDLPAAIRRVLAEWPLFAERARRGAEIIRNEFRLSRVASQYLRFLTYLAARPRPHGSRPIARPQQKRKTMWGGWTPRDPAVRERMLANILNAAMPFFAAEETAPLAVYLDATRELVFEYGAQKLHDRRTAPPSHEMIDTAWSLFQTALQAYPDSLVLRFNAMRTGVHFGTPEQRQEALRLARETVERPLETWQLSPMDDVYAWDFFAEEFHFRAYVDLNMEHHKTGRSVEAEQKALILASLWNYLGQAEADGRAAFAESTRLDPEFALYGLRYARALLQHGEEADVARAGALLAAAADGTPVCTEAFALLAPLVAEGRVDCPRFPQLEQAQTSMDVGMGKGEASWKLTESTAVERKPSGENQVTITRSGPQRDYTVSALVPIYNAERFMRGLLEDLEAQTIADQVEIVICDTASPQNERAIIEEFMARYDNIVYIHTAHRENSHEAANRCVQAATGKYLTTACADDRHRADALEVMAKALDTRPEVGLVYGDTLLTRIPNETFERNSAQQVTNWPDYSLRQLMMYNFFGPQSMWRRSLHADCGLFDPEYLVAGDYEMWVRLAWKSGAYHIPEILGIFLEGGNSSNRATCAAEFHTLLAHYRTRIPLEEIYPGLRRHAGDPVARAAALIDFGNGILSSASPDNPLTRQLYEQARALLGDHPVVLNNLGVIHCMLGNMEEGMALLQRLSNQGDLVARRNLNAIRSHGSAAPAQLQVGGLMYSFLDEMPPLLPPQETCKPYVQGNAGATGEGESMTHATCSREATRPSGISFVVITAGKRPELIALVLSSIRAQQIPDFEILVVGVYQDAPGLTYLPAKQAAAQCRRGAMRNLGMQAARYSRIVFLDDDCILAPDWYAAFQAAPQEFDLLTMRMQAPDGSRYWDHVMMDGNGKQRILDDDATDPLVYASSGALVIQSYVADAVLWDEHLVQWEDMAFSRQCQTHGYEIQHAPRCLVYHADATYTSIGRWTMRRSEGRTQRWVEALTDLSPLQLYAEGEAHLSHDRTAEAADCFRYGLLRYPDYTPFRYALAGIEAKAEGHLPGVAWYPEEDPAFHAALQGYGKQDTGVTPKETTLWLEPETAWAPVEASARSLWPSGPKAARLDPGDYTGEASALLLALEAAGSRLTVEPILTTDKELTLPVAFEARLQAALSRLPQQNAIRISSLFPPFFPTEGEGLRIGRAMFETDRLPADWMAACNRMDAVWVPSAFNRETFANSGVDPEKLAVVPCPIHAALYDPNVKPLPINGARGFNFLCSLDWKRSKGWETLIRAFVQEFTAADDVALILRPHTSMGYTQQQITQMVIGCVQQALKGNTAKMPTILVHDAPVPEENRPNLYRAVDCFVLASHGEAWGRPYMEAMAMGLPVIGTDWGGNTAFMTGRNSYLLRSKVVPIPPTAMLENPLTRGHQWAQPDGDHLRQLLREVFTKRDAARKVGAQARADVLAHFSYERVAEVMREELARLHARVPVAVGGSAQEAPSASGPLSVHAEILLG